MNHKLLKRLNKTLSIVKSRIHKPLDYYKNDLILIKTLVKELDIKNQSIINIINFNSKIKMKLLEDFEIGFLLFEELNKD